MAINLATGFSIGSKDVIDERQVLTLNQMQNLDENVYPDNYFAICKDDGKLYIFNASNEINAETGKFRLLSGGTGGGDTTYVLPPATDTTLGGVKVDNITITVDSEGVITAINAYTKTEVDDLLNNKLDKPAVDGTAGQILVLQDDGSLAYADIPGSGNTDDIQEELDKKLDKPTVDGTAGQILVLQDDGSLAYEDNVGGGTTDLTEINDKIAQLESKRVYNSLEELNTAKGLSIEFTNGEDNTMKIVDALSPIETFADYFSNGINNNRFGIDTITYGSDIALLSITKFSVSVTIIRAFMNNGKLLVRRYINSELENWYYDKVDLTNINTKLVQLETNQIKKSNLSHVMPTETCYKITPSDGDTFSKILMTDLYGGCILITGSIVSNYKSFKVVRLSNGAWSDYSPSGTTQNKINNVYYDGSFIYVQCGNYIKTYIEGGFTDVEEIDSVPTEATELPILDLTQGNGAEAALIPVAADNPTDYDLNNYVENGNYSIGTPANYSNVPELSSGLLTVTRANTYRLQVYTVVNNNNVYFRKSTDWGRSWSSWVLLNNDTRVTSLETQVSELFQSVSDGKTLVANAITDKGVSTSTTATFATMATNIGKISGSTINGYREETKNVKVNDDGTNMVSFRFSSNVVAVKSIISPPTGSSTYRLYERNGGLMFTISEKIVYLNIYGDAGEWSVTALVEA